MKKEYTPFMTIVNDYQIYWLWVGELDPSCVGHYEVDVLSTLLGLLTQP